MASRFGSLSRSVARASSSSSSLRSSSTTSLPRIRPPPFTAPRQNQRRFSFANPRTFGELGCTQSLLPLHSALATTRLISHLTLNARACCELAQGTFSRSCQDR